MFILETENLSRSFGAIEALGGINLRLEAGKQYAVQGASGSGKSTLLHLIGGLDRPTGGTVKFRGQNLASFSDKQLAHYRNRQVGLVFQFHFLLPSLTALGNILLPCDIAGLRRRDIHGEVESWAKRLGIADCLNRYPTELSGGQQQRINILRAISLRPPLILCDEPTGNLDSKNSGRVSSLLRDLAHEITATLVVVTHDKQVASHLQHTMTMEDGRMIAGPSPHLIFD